MKGAISPSFKNSAELYPRTGFDYIQETSYISNSNDIGIFSGEPEYKVSNYLISVYIDSAVDS